MGTGKHRKVWVVWIQDAGAQGTVGSSHSLNMGDFPKGESMALIQAATTLPMKPYFYLQPISLPPKFQNHRFSAS